MPPLVSNLRPCAVYECSEAELHTQLNCGLRITLILILTLILTPQNYYAVYPLQHPHFTIDLWMQVKDICVQISGHMNIRGPQLFYSFFSYAGWK